MSDELKIDEKDEIISEPQLQVKKGNKRAEYIVTTDMVDEDERQYVGTYRFKKLNAEKQAIINDRSVAVDPRTKTTVPKFGTQQLETIIMSLIAAPFDVSNENIKRKFCREMPAWLMNDLSLIAMALNSRLSDSDIKN